jgi:hypothetical protein
VLLNTLKWLYTTAFPETSHRTSTDSARSGTWLLPRTENRPIDPSRRGRFSTLMTEDHIDADAVRLVLSVLHIRQLRGESL